MVQWLRELNDSTDDQDIKIVVIVSLNYYRKECSVIPDEFEEGHDWDWEPEGYIPEDMVPGERMGVCVGGPEDGHRFPLSRVMRLLRWPVHALRM